MTALLAEETKKIIMVHQGNPDLHSDLLHRDILTTANGVCSTSKPELAAELEEKYPGNVIVANYPVRTAPRGRTMFTMPELPYKRKVETVVEDSGTEAA